jgi:fibronectin-binding autotransporter adhesin
MKTSLRRFPRLSILLGSIAATTQAATVVWDTDSISGGATGGSGSWDQTSFYWDTNGEMGPWSNVTNAADTAVFGGTAGTVSLFDSISAGGLRFDAPGYTVLGTGATITLANNGVIGTNFAAGGAVTLVVPIRGTNVVINPLVVNAAAGTLNQGRVVLGLSPENTGLTTISNGVLELNTGVTMSSGTGIIVNGSGAYHPNALGGAGGDYPYHRTRLGMLRIVGTGDFFGSQMVTLNGGTLLRLSPAGGSDTATVQNLTLGTGDNIIVSAPVGGAPNGDTLAITNLTRNANATVQFRSAFGTLGANGDDGKIAITNLNGVPVSNTNGILGGWAFANEAGAGQGNGFATAFATWDAGLQSVRSTFPDKAAGAAGGTLTGQPLSTGVATDNFLVNTNSTITSNVTINSLVEENDVIINSGATLTLNSGGLIFRTRNFWMQSADASGRLTSGDPSGNLYLNGAQTIDGLTDLRLRVRIVDNGATPVRLIKAGNASIRIGQYNNGGTTANSYTGGTIIQAGRLWADTVDAFGTGTVTVLPGGQAFLNIAGTFNNAFDLSGAGAPENAGVLGAIRLANAVTVAGNINLSGDSRLNVFNAADTATITGTISGSAGLEKAGAGVLVIAGSVLNTYTGDTLITGGTLRAGKTQAFGPAAAGAINVRGGALDVNGLDFGTKLVDIQGAGIGGAGAIVNNGVGSVQVLQRLRLSANATIGGPNRWDVRGAGSTVTLNGFTLTKTGNNLISILNGSISPGIIVVNQGQLGIEQGESVLVALASNIQINAGAALWVHDFGQPVTLTRALILNGGELTSNAAGVNGNSVIGSGVSVQAPSTINVADVGATMRLTGFIGGFAALSKIGNGTLQLDGNMSGSIPSFSSSGGTVLLNGSLSGVAAINVTGGKLTFGPGSGIPIDGTATFNGGVLDQSAAGYSFSGSRTLIVGRSGAPANDVLGNLTVGAGGTLGVGGNAIARTATFANNLTLTGTTVNFDLANVTTVGSGVNDLVNVAGTLNVSGGSINLGVNLLNGSYASGSYTLFTAGTLVGNASNFNFGSTVPSTRQTLAIDTTAVPNSVLLTATGSPAKSLTWVGGLNANAWDLTTTANWNDGVGPEVFYNLDSVTFLSSGGNPTQVKLAGPLQPALTTVNSSTPYLFEGPGRLTGGGGLTKQGTGTLVLTNTGPNDYTGVTTNSGGVLQVGGGGTVGTLGNGPVVNDGTLAFFRSDALTVANAISGSGNLVQAGAGTLTLTGSNSYTGSTTVNDGGTLSVASLANGGVNSGIGASANTADKLVFNGTLQYTGGATTTDRLFSIGLSSAALDASGTGAVVFSNPGAMGFQLPGERTLTLKGTNTNDNQLNISIGNDAGGTTDLVKEGPGTWVLNGANTFTGGVIINGGVLATDGSQTNNRIPAGNFVAINNTGTLEIRGINSLSTAIPLAYMVNQGGTLRVVSGGSPVIGAAGASHEHLGNITLNGGTLQLTYSGAGTALDGESFQLDGNIIVTGTQPVSVVTTATAAQQGIGLTLGRTFIVNDVTGSPAVDLTVGAEIENASGFAGVLNKDGTGTMQLNAASSHTGGTNVLAGTLRAGIAGVVGTGPLNVSAGGQVDMNGFVLTSTTSVTISGNGPDGNGALYNSATTGTISPAINSLTLSGNATIGGAGQRWDIGTSAVPVAINGGTNSLTKVGNSAVWFRGSPATTLGDIIVNGGLFGVEANDNALGTTGRAYVNFGGVLSIWGNGAATLATSQNKPITLNGGTLDNDWGNAGVSTWTGDVQITLDSFLRNDAAAVMALTGPISGPGGITVTTNTTGVIEFSGNNTYAGTTNLNGSVLRAGSSTAFSPNSAHFLMNANGRLRLNGFSNTLGSLSGIGGVDNSSPNPAVLSIGADNTNASFDGLISDGAGGGSLGLTKVGTGDAVLTAANSYTGPTTVNAGTLSVYGSLSGSPGVTVNSGGTLAGDGTVGAVTVLNGGTVNPGRPFAFSTVGPLNASSVVFNNGATLALDLNGNFVGPGYDQLNAFGSVTINGTIALVINLGFDPADFTDTFTIVNTAGGMLGYAGGARLSYFGNPLDQGEVFTVASGPFSQAFSISYTADGGNDIVLTAAPEPGSAALLLGGLALLASRRRRAA